MKTRVDEVARLRARVALLTASATLGTERLRELEIAAAERLSAIMSGAQRIAQLDRELAEVRSQVGQTDPAAADRSADAHRERETLAAELTRARASLELARSDAESAREQYELVAREVIVLRNETIWQAIGRRFGRKGP